MRLAVTVTLVVDDPADPDEDQAYVEAIAAAVDAELTFRCARARFRAGNGEPSTLALVRNVLGAEPGLLLD